MALVSSTGSRRSTRTAPRRWWGSTSTLPTGSAFERLEQESTTFVGRFSPRSDVKQGQQIRVAVDTRSLHVFDPESALAIYRGGSTS